MRFKSLTNDQTVPRYRCFNFYKPHKVDGKGFFSQMPTLKTVPSDQKSNRRTCAEEFHIPFKQLRKLSLKKISGLNGIRTHDLCETGAALYQLSYQGNWELVIQ